MKQWLKNYLTSSKPAIPPEKYTYNLEEEKKYFQKVWNDQNIQHTAQLADFELIQALGHGKFGNVVFARYKNLKVDDPKAYVAMKMMAIRKVVGNRGPQHVITEKKCLKANRNPFFIRYKHHFRNNANIFIVTEYVPGGDFYTRLKHIRKYEQPHVVFYSAQIVLALEYLHYMGVIYRDLKPENILLDKTGYIKIGDLGLCKKIDQSTTKTMCGTPEYLAPEVIYGRAYSYPVDWWTLGVLIFEMIYGQTPFRTKNLIQLLRRIVQANVVFLPTPEIPTDCKNLIMQLLRKHITERLSDPAAIKKMRYFVNIDWSSLYHQRIPAPYVPAIKSLTDTSNFDTKQEIQLEDSETELYSDVFKDF